MLNAIFEQRVDVCELLLTLNIQIVRYDELSIWTGETLMQGYE